MQTTIENSFWQFDTNHWFQQLNSSENGLSQVLVDKILFQQGLHPKNKSVFKKDFLLFVSQFKSPLMLLFRGFLVTPLMY
jgi:P-type Mg2+ transporter